MHNRIKKVIKIAAQKSHKKKRPRPLNRLGKTAGDTVSSSGQTVFAGEQTPKASSGMPSFSSDGSNMSVFSDLSFPEETSSFSDEDEFTPVLKTKSKPETTTVSTLNEDIPNLLIKAGYKVVKDTIINKLPVSFVALSAGQILLCLVDSEKGEWLADEERFNGEDPLWFSENSHRVSPIYQLQEAAGRFSDRLVKAGLPFKVVSVFVEAAGTIINAEDMKSVWDELGVITCRTASGGPEILSGFGESIPPAGEAISAEALEHIRNLF